MRPRWIHFVLLVALAVVLAVVWGRGRVLREDRAIVLQALREALGPRLPAASRAGALSSTEPTLYDKDSLYELIDGAAPSDRARVLGLVPLVPRLVLRYGFGPVYRRRQRVCWTSDRGGVQHDGATAVVTDASFEAVWDIIRDPTRVGEWSHECVGAEWLGDATEARPGARFRGRNRQGMFRWGRVCEIVSSEPGTLVWRTVPTKLYPDSTEWTLRAVRVHGATRIEQSFHVVKGTWLEVVYARFLPAHRERTAALTRDLERIGELAVSVQRAN